MKKPVIRALSAAMASLVLAASFAGCGTGTTAASASPAATTAAATSAAASESAAATTAASGESKKVVVWSNNRHDLDYMTKMVEEYNSAGNGITIEYVVQADNYTNMITMASSSNQAPDVMAISASDGISLKSFVDAKIIQPVTTLITPEYDAVNEVEKVKFTGLNVLDDQIYWVPTGMRSGSRLIYNVELFKASGIEVPKTMTELVAAAKKLTQDGAGKTYGVVFPGLSGPWGRWIAGCAEKSGVTVYDYKNGKFDFTGYKPFIEAVRQMFVDGSAFPGCASMKIDPVRTQFAEGLIGIHGNASQEVGVLTQQFPAKMEWGVAELPTLDGTVKGAETITPQFGWMISAATKDVASAWKVIEYFGSENFLKGYLENGYSLPISAHMDGVIDKSKTGRLADFALKEYESVYPVVPDVTPEGENYADAMWNAAMSTDANIDEVLANLTKSYNDALDKAVSMGKTKRLVIADYDPMHPSAGTATYLDK